MNFNSTRFGLVYHYLDVVVVVVVVFLILFNFFSTVLKILIYRGLSQHYSSGKIRSPVVAQSDQISGTRKP